MPVEVLRFLSWGDVSVKAWSAERGELVLELYKDDNEEFGLIGFRGVRHVCLPPRFVICGLRAGGAEVLPEGHLRDYYSGELELDSGDRVAVEHVFLFQVDVGPVCFVIAEALTYEIQDPGP